MNIFYVDSNPQIAAQSLHDKHVVKMIQESAQMLSCAHVHLDGIKPLMKYPISVPNHPCSKWVRQSWLNYDWLACHAMHLCDEYTHRYGRRHDYTDLVHWLAGNYPKGACLTETFVPPPQAMPDQYKNKNTVNAYRAYYNGEKLFFTMKGRKHTNRWTNRPTPDWVRYPGE